MNLFTAGADFVCFFFLLVIAVSVIMLKKSEKKYIYYLICVVSLMFFCVSDCIAFVMDEVGGNPIIHFYTNIFSYIGIDIALSAFIYFVCEKIKETVSFSKIHARIVLLICSIDLWLVVWGAYSGNLFKISGDTLEYGPMINYVGIAQLIVDIYFLILIFIYRKKLNQKLIRTLEFYFIFPAISLVIEFFEPGFELTYAISSILFLVVYIVVVREDMEEKILGERIMHKAAITDNLTGLLNRRAYSDDTAKLTNHYPENFVYMSLDVNGLKIVNDTIGHAAGDEIIVGASKCMKNSFGAYGEVYRIGGDEFTAILYISAEQLDRVVDVFDNEVANWQGKLVDNLSVSIGYVKAEEIQGASIHEISVLADKRMYAAKTAFYSKKGVDRRGQYEAHSVLCSLYTKILKINLTTDKYQIINMDADEQSESQGFADTISGWLMGFGKSGQVYKDDLDMYLQKTDINYLRDYFKKDKNTICIHYRRKYPDGYKQVVMEMIPTKDYTDDNQELFLYVKSIDN